MELKIKKEYLDSYIVCPFTKKHELVRFIDRRLYTIYNLKGLSWLFEEQVVKIKEEKDVISKPGNE